MNCHEGHKGPANPAKDIAVGSCVLLAGMGFFSLIFRTIVNVNDPSPRAIVLQNLPQINVAAIVDGDTIDAIPVGGGPTYRIRLANIDAPELSQPGGQQARSALTALLLLRANISLEQQSRDKRLRISVLELKQDRYYRAVSELYQPDTGIDINEHMVRSGNAWVYQGFCADLPHWMPLEEEAQERGLNVWTADPLPRPVPPWEFRKRRRNHFRDAGEARG